MYWLFNRDAFTNFHGRATEKLTWSQKRKFRGTLNDIIVFYQKDKDDIRFTHSYKITSKPEPEIEKGEVEKTEESIELGLTLLSNYQEEKPLYQYMYSFPRVKSYTQNLYRHFKNKYYRLSNQEFNAIDKDIIFVSRTIVGVALNSLHIEHKYAFIEYLAEEYPQAISGKLDYSILFNLIKEYISFSLIDPSYQLISGLNDAGNFVHADILMSLSFADEGQQYDRIFPQVSILKEALEQYEEALKELEGSKDNERIFNKIFSNSGLPIDL